MIRKPKISTVIETANVPHTSNVKLYCKEEELAHGLLHQMRDVTKR